MPKDWSDKPSCAPRHDRPPAEFFREDDPLEDFINGDPDDAICKLCDATGEVNGMLCKACGGKGYV